MAIEADTQTVDTLVRPSPRTRFGLLPARDLASASAHAPPLPGRGRADPPPGTPLPILQSALLL